MDNSLKENIITAFENRKQLKETLQAENTDAWRLFHGATEGRPGLTIDRFGAQVLIQSFRETLEPEEIKIIKDTVTENMDYPPAFVYNDRSGKQIQNIPLENEKDPRVPILCRELGIKYRIVGAHKGWDPLLFPDLRAARREVIKECEGKSVLNLFSYTCGVGIAAAANGASETWNVDFALSGLNYGKENAKLNNIPGDRIRFIQQDVIAVVRQLSGLGVKGKARRRKFMNFKHRRFDIVFLDPPTLAKSAFGTVDIIHDYQGLFKPSLLCVKPGGMLICTNHSPIVQLDKWLELMKRSAIKAGKEIKNIRVIQPEADYPSPDGKFPLKIAVVHV
ncbi:MAG: SAM-dependent methyltransferase [bacterium]|nr:SAM-dependent methyltransferase [bacterium]